MARVETRRQPRQPPAPPPAEDAKLEDWFADRLEAQGIPLRMSRRSNERMLAVLGLLIAVLGLFWAFSSAGSSSPSTAASTPGAASTATHTNGGGTSTSFKHHAKPPAWDTIQVDVLNGYGGSGAASSASETLASQGWKVGNAANAGTTAIDHTIVVYAPGHGAAAGVVARRLGLQRPLPLSSVQGLTPTATQGVAVVIGPNGLPGLS
jgi:hypothetical protein